METEPSCLEGTATVDWLCSGRFTRHAQWETTLLATFWVHERGLSQVMVEAGSELGTAMLKADLIDELVIYQAPILLGAGKSFIGDLGISNISEKLKLTLKSSTQIGSDIRMVLSRKLES